MRGVLARMSSAPGLPVTQGLGEKPAGRRSAFCPTRLQPVLRQLVECERWFLERPECGWGHLSPLGTQARPLEGSLLPTPALAPLLHRSLSPLGAHLSFFRSPRLPAEGVPWGLLDTWVRGPHRPRSGPCLFHFKSLLPSLLKANVSWFLGISNSVCLGLR